MNKAYILMGSNLGNRLRHLSVATLLIKGYCGKVLAQSSIYQTAAWGNENQPDFLNQVLELQTMLDPQDLLNALLHIEKKLGRIRKEKNGERTIDLDILLYNNSIIDSEILQIPHPRLHLRKFTLIPMAEIASDVLHPVLQQKISTLLQKCTDTLDVKKFSVK